MEFPEAILFDLDGVLLDTETFLAKAWSDTAKKYNYQLSKDQLTELKGRQKINCAQKVLEWINKEISIEELLSIQKSKLGNQLREAKPFKGSIELIKFCLKIKLPIALVTSSSSESYKIKSSLNPWLNSIPIKVLGDNKYISSGKPSPDPYLEAIKKLAVNPKRTWVIEDSYSGSVAGLRAGCYLWFFSEDKGILNKLISEFSQNKIQRINELAEIIYFLKLLKGF